jgi:hypothetical protein
VAPSQTHLDELRKASKNRDAHAASAVFSRSDHSPVPDPFTVFDDLAIVVYDKDNPDPAALRLACAWARWIVQRDARGSDEGVRCRGREQGGRRSPPGPRPQDNDPPSSRGRLRRRSTKRPHRSTNSMTEDHTAGDRLVQLLADQSAPSRYWPDDDEFIAGVLQPNIYRVLRGPRLRVMLGGIETALRREKSEQQFMPAQVAKLTVEHLIPQKWSQFYPLPTDRPAEEAEARRNLAVHKLGNLTLTTTKLNSSISNGSWPTKRKELNKHAVLLLTAGSVLQAPPGVNPNLSFTWPDTWDEDRVELRTLFLATIACQAWPAPTGADGNSPDQIRSKVASTQADIDALIAHRAAETAEGSEPTPEPEVSDVARRAVSLAFETGMPGTANTRSSSESSYSGSRRSIARHITEAFAGHPIGTFLSVAEIRSFESSEYESDLPSAGAISAALQSPNWASLEYGIIPGNGGEKGVFGATKAESDGS